MEHIVNFFSGCVLLFAPIVMIIIYVLGIYALILLIKALKIYIRKNQ